MKKLREGERLQRHEAHLPDREGFRLRMSEAQQGVRGDDAQVRSELVEVLQRADRVGTILSFVKEQQGAGPDGLAGAQAELPDDLLGREVVVEDFPQTGLRFEVEVVVLRREVPAGEVLHQPSFADLAHPLEDEGLAVGVVHPADEIFGGSAFHGETWGEWVRGYALNSALLEAWTASDQLIFLRVLHQKHSFGPWGPHQIVRPASGRRAFRRLPRASSPIPFSKSPARRAAARLPLRDSRVLRRSSTQSPLSLSERPSRPIRKVGTKPGPENAPTPLVVRIRKS